MNLQTMQNPLLSPVVAHTGELLVSVDISGTIPIVPYIAHMFSQCPTMQQKSWDTGTIQNRFQSLFLGFRLFAPLATTRLKVNMLPVRMER